MFLHIEPDNGLAIYDQIVRQIKFAVAGGALPPAELIPSVRELARELAVNPNTVSRAYQQLQLDGVLETIRGQGLAVAKGADRRCRAERLQLLGARLADVLAESLRAGLSLDDIRQLVNEQVEQLRQRRDHVLQGRVAEPRRDSSSQG
ncbi:MAG: GntR family transcriptional regulator [Pirellulales bacterium]